MRACVHACERACASSTDVPSGLGPVIIGPGFDAIIVTLSLMPPIDTVGCTDGWRSNWMWNELGDRIGAFDVSQYRIGAFDVSRYRIGAFDVSRYGIGALDVSRYGIGAFDVSRYRIGAFDVSRYRIGALDVSRYRIGALDVSRYRIGVS